MGEVPAFEAKIAWGTGLARGFGDWILVAAVRAVGRGSSSSESEDSEEDDEEDDAEDASLSSRNSNTLGTFFVGSVDCVGGIGAASGFSTFLETFVLCGGEWLRLGDLGDPTEPVCEFVVTLETVDDVRFLPSFFVDFLMRIVLSGMMIGGNRKRLVRHVKYYRIRLI